MSDYHKQELLVLADDWNDVQLANYIRSLEQRIENTREWLKELRALQKRRKKYDKIKDTGIRSG